MNSANYVSARCNREASQGQATSPCWIWTMATANHLEPGKLVSRAAAS